MALFAVMFHDHDPEAIERLKAAYPAPDHLELQTGVYLINGDLLIEDILKRLGIDRSEGQSALVFRLNGTYGGKTYRSVWDWLARTEVLV